MRDRKAEIKSKGFALVTPQIEQEMMRVPTDFSQIKVGVKKLVDASLDLGSLKKVNRTYADKKNILSVMQRGDIKEMRNISEFYFRTNGIYSRLCRYMAYLYRYDWMITPYFPSNKMQGGKNDKIIDTFYQALFYLDDFEVKKFFGEVALQVMRYGAYYCYVIPGKQNPIIQELPVNYCRSRIKTNNKPVVEFQMSYFDEYFSDVNQRMQILKMFPDEFKKGYQLYKANKLPPLFQGDTKGWFPLEPGSAYKFNINGDDFPFLISTVPALIDLDEAIDLDKKKMEQKLLKIIIQKMPLDKNGDLVFDVDEARELHNNAVQMLSKGIGLDVLTTFADVEVANMEENNSSAADDAMNRIKQAVYDQAGVSQLQFNSTGNIASNNSVLNDESSMYNMLLQFEGFLNDLLQPFNKTPKKMRLKAQILTTTIYNYKEMSKLYKEQTQLGYSKMLPQIALGQSQVSILANAYFENEILELSSLFIPPAMSSTMNAAAIEAMHGKGASQTAAGETKTAGRNEKPDNEKSDKTIQNKESMS